MVHCAFSIESSQLESSYIYCAVSNALFNCAFEVLNCVLEVHAQLLTVHYESIKVALYLHCYNKASCCSTVGKHMEQ